MFSSHWLPTHSKNDANIYIKSECEISNEKNLFINSHWTFVYQAELSLLPSAIGQHILAYNQAASRTGQNLFWKNKVAAK